MLAVGIDFPVGSDVVRASHMGAVGEEHQKGKRPLFVYPGNYREKVSRLKEKFKSAFGYELMDLDEGWRPEEIERLHNAFSRLPENFYWIEGLKGFYRAAQLQIKNSGRAGRTGPHDLGNPCRHVSPIYYGLPAGAPKLPGRAERMNRFVSSFTMFYFMKARRISTISCTTKWGTCLI